MTETVQVTLDPAPRMIVPVAIGSLIALLTITAIGTILGLAIWPLLGVIYRQANRGLGAAAFFANFVTATLTYFLVRWLARKGEDKQSTAGSAALLAQNVRYLRIAQMASIFACVEAAFGFLRQEGSNFVIVQLGNATQIDFLRGVWIVALGFVLPVVFLVLLLIGAAKLQPSRVAGA